VFLDRVDAGARLGAVIESLSREGPARERGWFDRPVVLGLARGGVVVAAEVARVLRAPLDVLVVRKVGHPDRPELGLGAIGEGGVAIFNETLVDELEVPATELARSAARAAYDVAELLHRYRAGRPATDVAGRAVIVVDDGLATGSTALAAVTVLRLRSAAAVVLAAPVAPPGVEERLASSVDAFVCLETPDWFPGVGAAYEDFRQVGDGEVQQLLARPVT
jgi:predicted phosphoribosyltransferase